MRARALPFRGLRLGRSFAKTGYANEYVMQHKEIKERII